MPLPPTAPAPVIRLATRRSALAMAQTGMVAGSLRAACPGCLVELTPMSTRGDRTAGPLAPAGGKGLFTAELEDALREARVHAAVHSAKDLPEHLGEAFTIAAVPRRADPRDALVSRHGPLADLPPGARVGTGSLRRKAQLLTLREDLDVVAVRGNVETRLGKALGERPELDAVVLAMAGLIRSGLDDDHAGNIHPFHAAELIPAAGQGSLAVEALADDHATCQRLARIDHAPSRAALTAERGILRYLQANCHSCVAVHVAPACPTDARHSPGADAGNSPRRGAAETAGADDAPSTEPPWLARAMVARPDATGVLRVEAAGPTPADAADALRAALERHEAPARLAGTA